MLSSTTMVLGAGALAGFNYANFTVLPSVTKKAGVSQMSTSLSNIFSTYMPFSLLFISLTLLDDFISYGIPPALLAYGFVWTTIFLKSRALQLPLWYVRQYSRFVLTSIFFTLMAGYCMM